MNQIVSTEWLAGHLQDEGIVIADVRWVHKNSEAAHQSYLTGHIPGAVFVDVDADLSELGDYSKGRHPLPTPEDLVERLARKGIGKGKRVICTEEEAFKVAARLWWLLRWIGVDDVLVLDGGVAKWRDEGRPIETRETVLPSVEPFDIRLRSAMMIEAPEVARRIKAGETVLDARAAERYRGEVEALDKRAGHIDGAMNLPLDSFLEGNPPRLKSGETLAEVVRDLRLSPSKPVTAYCGSGVTACQLLWGLSQLGFENLILYPGSWSEWIELHPEAGVALT
ncbi:MAG: sulfurtransferase [Calditrichaeota bacterium]|nr:sulfurtransferase [Calditrichota bacterium]MCB9368947.1 sulfurtransferase [Calditrichota bacterium]